jgi:hypothetical protein
MDKNGIANDGPKSSTGLFFIFIASIKLAGMTDVLRIRYSVLAFLMAGIVLALTFSRMCLACCVARYDNAFVCV